MIVRKLRLERGWSQDQLAHISGLNIRTIQRIERGHTAGLDSAKALAAAFGVSLTQLQEEAPMTIDTSIHRPSKTHGNIYRHSSVFMPRD